MRQYKYVGRGHTRVYLSENDTEKTIVKYGEIVESAQELDRFTTEFIEIKMLDETENERKIENEEVEREHIDTDEEGESEIESEDEVEREDEKVDEPVANEPKQEKKVEKKETKVEEKKSKKGK